MRKKKQSVFSQTINNYGLVIALVLFFGMMFGDSVHADLSGGSGGIFATGKTTRLITVVLAGVLALVFFTSKSSKALNAILRGNLAFLACYGLLALSSIIFSQLRLLTLFKSVEIIIVVMMCAIVLSAADRRKAAVFFIKGVFWVYVISTFTALLETLIVGTGLHKQLIVGRTPLLSTMMQSNYPPMVGNALGYLGALASLFGVYLFDSSAEIKGTYKSKTIASIIAVGGFSVLFLSYTRSILAFYFLGLMILFFLEKRWGRIVVMASGAIAALALPQVQSKIIEHMRRGSSDEQLVTLSGRTDFWDAILSRDAMQLLVGEGFSSGSRMAYLKGANVINAHNSVVEIIVNLGFIGALIWLILMLRVSVQLVSIRKRMLRDRVGNLLHFHNFLIAVFIMSMLRCLMNSSWVYLDYFFLLMAAFVVYAEAFRFYRPIRRIDVIKTPRGRNSGSPPSAVITSTT